MCSWIFVTGMLLVCCNVELVSTLQCKETDKIYSSKIDDNSYHPCHRTCEYPSVPKICEFEFRVEWTHSLSGYCFDCPLNPAHCNLTNCLPLDGNPRLVAVTNGMTPGPSIQVCQGDTIRVKVHNHLHDHGGLSIHWHGPHQRGTNWMDGVSMITQCPIAYSTYFVYEFLADPAGTHWWHAHSGFYRADGVYGALIIRKSSYEEKNRHLYDLDLPEHIMIVTDWSPNIGLEDYIAQSTASQLPPISSPQTILINGKGQGREFTDAEGNIVYTPRSIFHVKPGIRYRFRVISNAVTACNIKVSVDGHFMWIIATDGSEVRNVQVDSFIIASGERYDFVIAASAAPMSYLIRVTGISPACDYAGNALLCYRDAPCVDPESTTPPWPTRSIFSALPKEHNINKNQIYDMLNLFDTYSLDEMDPELDIVTLRHYISFSFTKVTIFDGTSNKYFSINVPKINNVGFTYPHTPVLLKKPENICEPHLNSTMMKQCKDFNCKCTNILKLKLGEVVEFVIANVVTETLALDHPVHIHGQAVRIVGLGVFSGKPQSIDEVQKLDNSGNLTRINSIDAVIKDTVIVPGNGYAIMRWKTDNPGIWFFHCHIENHLEDGMAMVVQVGEDEDIKTPPEDFPSCGNWPV